MTNGDTTSTNSITPKPIAIDIKPIGPIKSVETKLYKKRWLMLLIFSFLSLCNAMTWITYSPIATLSMQLYDVGTLEINMLSLIYMILYVPFVLPAAWIIDWKGLRFGITIGAVLNVVGCWLRYFGKDKKTFFLVFIGQSLASLAQTFILGIPPRLSANWFGEKERATATSIGAIFNQLGTALAFLLSTLIVKKIEDISILVLVQAVLTSVASILVFIFFRGNPPIPPSTSAAVAKTDFKKSFKEVAKNRDYMLLLFGFGLNVGAFYAVSTLLDQIVSPFGYSSNDTGIFGFLIIIIGVVGAIVVGVLADKTKKLKLLLCICYIGTLFSMIWFLFAVRPNNYSLLAVTCSSLGLFMTAVLPISMEAAVEVTFPIAEEFSSGLILMAAQIFGIAMTLIMPEITKVSKADYANWFIVGGLVIAALLMLIFKTKPLHCCKISQNQTKK